MRCGACGSEQPTGRFCGRCGALLGRDDGAAAGAGGPEERRRRSRSTVRSAGPVTVALVAVVAVVVAASAATALLSRSEDAPAGRVSLPSPSVSDPSDTETTPPSTRVEPSSDGFATDTGTALVFDDGHDGAVVLDLDSGEHVRIQLPGQRAGDQPFRLWRMGGWLVVGWQEIWAVAPGGSQPARKLGEATVFVPDADPRRLWLVDYPGGRLGSGRPTWTLVDGSGDVIHETEGFDGFTAIRGVPGGLALRGPDGELRRHVPGTDRIDDYLGGAFARLADVGPEHVLWCERHCSTLSLVGPDRELTLSDDVVVAFEPGSVWLSDGATHAAALAAVRVPGGAVEHELLVFELERGEVVARTPVPAVRTHGDWTADGQQFFYWAHDPNAVRPDPPAELGRWTPGGGFERIDLDPDGPILRSFVTMPAGATAALFDEPTLPLPSPDLAAGWRVHEERRMSIHLPPGWHVTTRRFGSGSIAAGDILTVATFDLASLPEATDEDGGCPMAREPLEVADESDVVIAVDAPRYAKAVDPRPRPLGTFQLDRRALEDVRQNREDGPCGNDRVTMHRFVGSVAEWSYDVWVAIGREVGDTGIDAAMAVVNSFRPAP